MNAEQRAAALRLAAALLEPIVLDKHAMQASDLLRALAAEPVADPVAWMYESLRHDDKHGGPYLIWKPTQMDAMSASKGAEAIPLYTHPPKDTALREAAQGVVDAWLLLGSLPSDIERLRVALEVK